MPRTSARTLAALSALVLLSALPASAQEADDVTIEISATVAEVEDPDGLLGGAVQVGDTVTGQYTYDASTPDSDSRFEGIGRYRQGSGYGITVDVGGLEFATDTAYEPARDADGNITESHYFLEILNDRPTILGDMDNYLIRSYHNRPLANGTFVEHISWQLDDPTATALSSAALPTTPPDLAAFESLFGLEITGCTTPEFGQWCPADRFFIRAHVTSARLVGASPVPIAIDVSPGSEPNCVRNDGNGVIPVAILSDDGFDATDVDATSVALDGQAVRIVGRGTPQAHAEDVNGDGLDDLVVQIADSDGVYASGEAVATLTGATIDGTRVEGTDAVCVVP